MIGSTPHAHFSTPVADAPEGAVAPDTPDQSWDRVVGEFRRSLLGARLAESLARSERRRPAYPEPSRTLAPSGGSARIVPPRGQPNP